MSELTPKKGLDHEVTYALTFKRNLGNFENVDIHVGLKVANEDGMPSESLAKARQWVEHHLAIAVEEVTDALKG